MSNKLTKNARWIVFWARYTDKSHFGMFAPKETIFNIGRVSYKTPTTEAINDLLNFGGYLVLASMVYEVDVSIKPYQKQHKEVTKIAEEHFKKRLKER